MGKVSARVIIFSLLLLASVLGIFIFKKVSVREDGITVSLPQASFYIPSEQPVKVYKFNPSPPELLGILENNTQDYPADFGIYIKNLSTGQEVSLNADVSFNAASLYKLAVMYTIYKKGSEGQLDLSDPKIKDNLQAMITVSSNEAAYFLVEHYTSWEEVNHEMEDLGLKNTSLNQIPIVTTPSDMGKLLELMAQGQAVNLEVSYEMLKLMSAQKINDRIPVHLPPNAIVAHKTGELGDVRNDAGVIIGPDNNYILVLMSKNLPEPEKIKPLMAKISYEVYDFFVRQWDNPPEIL